MLENSKAKLAKKNADMIVANNLKVAGAGFGTDTNVVTLITADDCTELEIMDKSSVAARIMDRLLKMQSFNFRWRGGVERVAYRLYITCSIYDVPCGSYMPPSAKAARKILVQAAQPEFIY